MRMAQLNQEPSMEDILASIKRIIAEDSEAAGARPAKLRREAIEAVSASPVLAKKRRAAPVVDDEPESVVAAAQDEPLAPHEATADDAMVAPGADEVSEAAPIESSAPDMTAELGTAVSSPGRDDETPDVLELTSPMSEAPIPEVPMPEAAVATEVPATAAPKAPVSRGAHGLTSSPAAQASRDAFAALGQLKVRSEEGAPNTLEGLVGDLLRPMLREWLDRELPALVERLVSAEVARLSGRG